MSAGLLGVVAGVVAVGSMAVWVRRLRAVNIPRNRTGFLALYVAAMVLGIYALTQGAGWLGGTAAVIAILVGVINLVLRAQSRQAPAVPSVTVGGPILDFTAPDDSGEEFDLASLKGTPFLLKFFRGHW